MMEREYRRVNGHSRCYIKVVCPKCQEERWTREDNEKRAKHFPHCFKCAPHGVMLDRNPAWKGGRIIHRGYVLVKVVSTSRFYSMMNNHGYIPEHRLVMAKSLGRPLLRKELVHHIDGNKQNNDISNLELLTTRKHKTQYREGYRIGYEHGYRAGLGASSKAD